MKHVALALALTFSANVFAAEYVTVEVCGYSENSNVSDCKMVTYKKRSPNTPSENYQFPLDATAGIPNENGKVPKWLAKLSQKLIDAGFKPVESISDVGGAQ